MFGRVAFAACWFILGFVLLFLYIPIVIVLAVSFTESAVFSFPPQGFSLKWYSAIRNADGLIASAWLSAQIAFLSTCVSKILRSSSRQFCLTRADVGQAIDPVTGMPR